MLICQRVRINSSTKNSKNCSRNADFDDDGDGFSDEHETLDGTEPLDRYDCNGCFDFDIDIDGETAALTDGLLLLRYLFGFEGATLIEGAIRASATRTTSEEIKTYIQARISTGS